MIETLRLILRPWREADREPFAALNDHPEVAEWLGGEISRAQSDQAVDRYIDHINRRRFGKWAVERSRDGILIGAVGVMPVIGDYPFGGYELGWRLARHAWDQGYASEAAKVALEDALERLRSAEVIAFTSDKNLRSVAVMERIGMVRDRTRDFDHPALPPGHPLLRHVIYVAGGSAITTA